MDWFKIGTRDTFGHRQAVVASSIASSFSHPFFFLIQHPHHSGSRILLYNCTNRIVYFLVLRFFSLFFSLSHPFGSFLYHQKTVKDDGWVSATHQMSFIVSSVIQADSSLLVRNVPSVSCLTIHQFKSSIQICILCSGFLWPLKLALFHHQVMGRS